PAISDGLLQKVARVLPRAGRVNWLAPGVAVDIIFGEPANQAGAPASLLKKLSRELRSIIGAAPVDIVVQPQDARRKKLLVADMDSTMIGQECIDELA